MVHISADDYHVLACIVEGSTMYQDGNWGWFIGAEPIREDVIFVLWTMGWIQNSQIWKLWDITDAGRAALAEFERKEGE